jgi:uncharacterized protein YbjQ (UPF0145 family)
MKEKDILKIFHLESYDMGELRSFLDKNNVSWSENFMGSLIVDDDAAMQYIPLFIETRNMAEQAKKEAVEREKREVEEEAARKKKAMAEMLITSGFSFDGYTIKKYSGYISGDDAISVDRGMAVFGSGTNVKDKLMESLVVIRRNALRELKEAAYDLGCNAVIGVDFDYLTLDPQTANFSGGTTYQPYVFGVTANGNAVIIEKNPE